MGRQQVAQAQQGGVRGKSIPAVLGPLIGLVYIILIPLIGILVIPILYLLFGPKRPGKESSWRRRVSSYLDK